jgi:CRISPR-associated protein Cas2
MFDLPTDTKLQRSKASLFRNFLLNQGFERSQFSVYARFVNGKEGFETRVRKIEQNLPNQGNIQILQFTDKQYENIKHYSDQGKKYTKKNPNQLLLF